jgi:hypothetical protein
MLTTASSAESTILMATRGACANNLSVDILGIIRADVASPTTAVGNLVFVCVCHDIFFCFLPDTSTEWIDRWLVLARWGKTAAARYGGAM